MRKSKIRYITDAQAEEIIQLYKGGLSAKKLGKQFHCRTSQIIWLMRKHGVPLHKGAGDIVKVSRDEVERLKLEVQAGWDEKTERLRRVIKPSHWSVPTVTPVEPIQPERPSRN